MSYLTTYLKFKARYTLKFKYIIRQLLTNHNYKKKKYMINSGSYNYKI